MKTSGPIKVIHVYKEFNVYNALFGTILLLMKYIDKEKFVLQLCVLQYTDNPWGREFQRLGGKIVSLNVRSRNILRAVSRLADYLRREEPDIVQTHEMKMNIIGRIAAMIAGATIMIGTIWTLRDTAFSLPRRIRDWSLQPVHRWLDRRSKRVIAISRAIRDEWDRRGTRSGYDIIYIPYEVERTNKEANDTATERVISAIEKRGSVVVGLVSRLSEEKGIQYLLRATPEILEAEKNIVVCIAGEGKYRTKLEGIVRELHIEPNVVFLGHVNNIARFYQIVDVFVQPSRSESLGVAIMEAMSMGIPVVATKVGGIPEIVQDKETGLLVGARRVGDLAAAIIYLLANPEARARMGEKAGESVRNRFGVQDYVGRMTKLYEEVALR